MLLLERKWVTISGSRTAAATKLFSSKPLCLMIDLKHNYMHYPFARLIWSVCFFLF
jgi:hypothetical protein